MALRIPLAPRFDERPIEIGTALTQREFEVARLIGKARQPKRISEELGINCETIKSRSHIVMKKTGARTAAQLVYWMNCELFLAGLQVRPKG